MQDYSPAVGGDGLFALVRVESQQMPTGSSLVKEKPLQHDLMDNDQLTNTLTIKVPSQFGSPGKAILHDRTVSEGSFHHWKGLDLYSFYETCKQKEVISRAELGTLS